MQRPSRLLSDTSLFPLSVMVSLLSGRLGARKSDGNRPGIEDLRASGRTWPEDAEPDRMQAMIRIIEDRRQASRLSPGPKRNRSAG